MGKVAALGLLAIPNLADLITNMIEQVYLDLNNTFTRYISADPKDRAGLTLELAHSLRSAIHTDHCEQAHDVLRRSVEALSDYTGCQSLTRVLKELRKRIRASNPPIRIAILGSFTTKQLADFVELSLFGLGINAEIYQSDFGLVRQEIIDPESQLYKFSPNFVWIAINRSGLVHRPEITDSEHKINELISAECRHWRELWERLHERSGSQIIQSNFVLPAWRTLGNHEMRVPGGESSFLARLNRTLLEDLPGAVLILDADSLATSVGRWNWEDARFVHHAKLPCAPEYIWDYARLFASLVGVQCGAVKKCLVLDLDNTLWGGVVGDDGLGGLRLGQGSAEGEAYLAFQTYIKSLKARGVLLAVCSKNNDSTAREVFECHPEMRLRLDDISLFVSNWNDKATNIRTISQQLNIGLNSLVFVDDNPAERAIVRQLLPEVAVPELSDDVTNYVRDIDRHQYFQVTSIAPEDFERSEYYRADALRRMVQTSASDMEAYLKSLEMKAKIAPISELSLERAVQLIQRSNQFNLTTRRYSVADISRIMADPEWQTVTVSLRDRFGDNGLISVALLHRVGGRCFEIDTWLMSCRVLKRGVEQALLNHICDVAKKHDISTIRGEYIPTTKNGLVSGHYSNLGFKPAAEATGAGSIWELSITDWTPIRTQIELVNRTDTINNQ
jgi:FkbH-like protein